MLNKSNAVGEWNGDEFSEGLRNDYDDFAEFDEEDVKKSFDEMQDFIRTIRALL